MDDDNALRQSKQLTLLERNASRLTFLLLSNPLHQAFEQRKLVPSIELDVRDYPSARYEVSTDLFRQACGSRVQWRRRGMRRSYLAADLGENFEVFCLRFHRWKPLGCLPWEELLREFAEELGVAERISELKYSTKFYSESEDDARLQMLRPALQSPLNTFWTEHHRSARRRMEVWLDDFNSPEGRYGCTIRIYTLWGSRSSRASLVRSVQEFKVFVSAELLYEVSGGAFAEKQFMTRDEYHQWWAFDVMQHMGKEGAEACRSFSSFLFLCHKRGEDPRRRLRGPD